MTLTAAVFFLPSVHSVSIWNTTKLHNCNFPSNFRNYVSQLPKVEAYFAIFQIAAKVEKAIKDLGRQCAQLSVRVEQAKI